MKALVPALFLCVLNLAYAQQPPRPGEDPIGANFFNPEVIMNHQADIALKDNQRQTIIDQIKKMQSDSIETQFKLKAAMQELVGILSLAKVDEGKALAALHKLTKIEDEMKTMHVTMMVRIKNALTKEQQDKLKSFSQ